MKGQFIKDFMLIKRDIIISVVIYILFISAVIIFGNYFNEPSIFVIENAVFSIIVCSAIPLILLAETMLIDDKCGYLQNAFASPLPRKDYVREKHIVSVVLNIIGIVLGEI